jgi:small-conductance mechanosensitive channel
MIVEEMNILTTVFLRYDNEKIYYPNATLLTKPISNFRRSPDMADCIDFSIDVSTSTDDVTSLKKAIQL